MRRKAGAGDLISNRQIALIHVARSRVGMTEDDYRSMLAGLGVESSKALDQGRFDEAMRRFAAWGFEPRGGKGRHWRGEGQHGQSIAGASEGKGPQGPVMLELEATLGRLSLPMSYADGIARQMFGVEGGVRWLKGDQLFKVLQALKVYTKRMSHRKGAKGAKGAKLTKKKGARNEKKELVGKAVEGERKNGTDEA